MFVCCFLMIGKRAGGGEVGGNKRKNNGKGDEWMEKNAKGR